MPMELDRSRSSKGKPVKSSKPSIDETKLTEPQRKALAIAKDQGVPFHRKLEDLVPNFELTPEEADQFDKTLQQMRAEGRRTHKNKF